MTYREKFNYWLEYPLIDDGTKKELSEIKSDDNEIKERFFADLEFGTGGLRGIIGAGTARMNIYTVRRATQGLAQHILKGKNKSVVIAYDSRNFSPEFAMEAARVLSSNGVKTYIFDELRPTPELSFAVRFLGCAAGIVVTASHNPAEYNGYKVYGSDGGQLSGDAADAVINEINSLDIFEDIKTGDESLISYIGKEVDEAYYKSVISQMIAPSVIKKAENMKIVYTPFHGAGNKPVREVLKRVGFKNVIVVSEQEKPDGNFPTVKSPNPENPEGFYLAVELAKKENADLIIGTDPDSDRVGVLVRCKDEFIPLTGNQTGALLTEYILSARKRENNMPENPYVVKTIVTSEMIRAITDFYEVELIDVLTGFKFIAGKIAEFEKTGEKNYVFGFEESYGYLPGTAVRDKDGVAASMLLAEMSAWYYQRGMTLYDGLLELFQKYGLYKEWNLNVYMEGLDGAEKISAIMSRMRSNLPTKLGGMEITAYSDFLSAKRTDVKTGAQTETYLPKSNVLRFEIGDKNFVALRPSGTEPKIKVYVGVTGDDADSKIKAIKEDIEKIFEEK